MSTKKFLCMASFLMFLTIALPASSAVIAPESSKVNGTEMARTTVLTQRLEEIRSMNKSEMTRLEKKSLRNEVKEIKKEMKVMSGGVYLSVGAIIIVILLLILLL